MSLQCGLKVVNNFFIFVYESTTNANKCGFGAHFTKLFVSSLIMRISGIIAVSYNFFSYNKGLNVDMFVSHLC